MLRDEILHCVQNDKVEALGAVVATIKKGPLILRYAQNDRGGTWFWNCNVRAFRGSMG